MTLQQIQQLLEAAHALPTNDADELVGEVIRQLSEVTGVEPSWHGYGSLDDDERKAHRHLRRVMAHAELTDLQDRKRVRTADVHDRVSANLRQALA